MSKNNADTALNDLIPANRLLIDGLPITSQLDVLEQLPAFKLLQQLLPVLQNYCFGVGGSLLLTELGLVNQARDVDLVCHADDFAKIVAILSSGIDPILRPVTVPPHPLYQSRCFARFAAVDNTELDLMAGIRVETTPKIEWQFDPSQLQWRHGVPWMTAQQWVELYQLFQRPERVAVLQLFLQQSAGMR